MSPWTRIADDLVETVPLTTAERLSSWVGPVTFVVALAVVGALCGPFAAAAVILGPWRADWRTPW
jgi:hypothetical protein